MFVIIIIVGFALPVVFALGAAIYCYVKEWREERRLQEASSKIGRAQRK